jgi:hypothetical protein
LVAIGPPMLPSPMNPIAVMRPLPFLFAATARRSWVEILS